MNMSFIKEGDNFGAAWYTATDADTHARRAGAATLLRVYAVVQRVSMHVSKLQGRCDRTPCHALRAFLQLSFTTSSLGGHLPPLHCGCLACALLFLSTCPTIRAAHSPLLVSSSAWVLQVQPRVYRTKVDSQLRLRSWPQEHRRP